MRILSQRKDYMVNLERFEGLIMAINERTNIYAVGGSNTGSRRVFLGEYSSEQKARTVLSQIFEYTGDTFIMPQDEEVEV